MKWRQITQLFSELLHSEPEWQGLSVCLFLKLCKCTYAQVLFFLEYTTEGSEILEIIQLLEKL